MRQLTVVKGALTALRSARIFTAAGLAAVDPTSRRKRLIPANSTVDSGTAVSGKKQGFMETLLPVLEKENQRLSRLRK
jgi:hypothetical protein